MRRNSLFSLTSATHSISHSRMEMRNSDMGYRRRLEPSFVTAYDDRGDSLSLAGMGKPESRAHGTNLDVRVFLCIYCPLTS